jgi:VanZ family protein
MRQSNKTIIKYISITTWMIVIFYLSNEPAVNSTARSSIFLHAIQSIDILSLQNITELVVRKSAHFLAYFILGVLIFNVVKEYISTTKHAILWSIAVAAIYACTDEIHQLYISGRSGQLGDVLIDTTGAALGIIIYIGVLLLYRNRIVSRK